MKLICHMWVLAGVSALMLAGAPVAAQSDLPADVVEAYRSYEAAVEAGDTQAASHFAARAWRAGESSAVDPVTLALLADNAAQYLSVVGDHQQSSEAFERAGELLELSGADPIEISQSWRLAAEAAFRAEDYRAADRLADRAGDFLETLPSSGERYFELARSRGVQSFAAWRLGDWRQAGRRGAEAFEAYQGAEAGLTADHALFAFYAGVEQVVQRRPAAAAWWLSVADYLFNELGVDSDTGEAIRAWSSYARDELTEPQRIALLQRLSREGFIDEPCAEDCADRSEPGWRSAFPEDADVTDAAPVRRSPPVYPVEAARADLDGVALMRFDVDERGRPQNIEVVFAVPHIVFGEAGVEAVRDWRYEPATVNGEPVVREGYITRLIYEMQDW